MQAKAVPCAAATQTDQTVFGQRQIGSGALVVQVGTIGGYQCVVTIIAASQEHDHQRAVVGGGGGTRQAEGAEQASATKRCLQGVAPNRGAEERSGASFDNSKVGCGQRELKQLYGAADVHGLRRGQGHQVAAQ